MKFIITEFNVIEFFASVLFTLAITYFIYRLRPSLGVSDISWDDVYNNIRIKIANSSNHFSAVNLRVEVAIIIEGGNSLHLDVDYPDLLMLPPINDNNSNTRTLKINNFTAQAINYIPEGITLADYIQDETNVLRIRIHSYHEFSGLGKAFQKISPCPLPLYVHQPAPAPNP
jgi:hypothetical protein